MPNSHTDDTVTAEVLNFDDALLDACSLELRTELLEEAAMLMQAFAPEGRAEQLTAMAKTLSSGLREGKRMERVRARRLAAALRHLAQTAAG